MNINECNLFKIELFIKETNLNDSEKNKLLYLIQESNRDLIDEILDSEDNNIYKKIYERGYEDGKENGECTYSYADLCNDASRKIDSLLIDLRKFSKRENLLILEKNLKQWIEDLEEIEQILDI